MKTLFMQCQLSLDAIKQNKKSALIAFFCMMILVLLTGAIASDMYVPSLPHIASYFQIPGHLAKLTVSLYMLGFAFGQLFWGPLSDSIGRKKALLSGISVGFLGSLICVLSHDIYNLITGRMVQGFGVACSLTIVRSSIRDVLKGEVLAALLGYLSLVFGMVPALAPILGSYIQHFFDWRAVFYVLTIYMIFIVFLVFIFLPETVTNAHKHPLKIKQILKDYVYVASNITFLSCAISAGVCLSGIIAYVTISPFLFQNVIGISVVHYGWLTLYVTITILLGRGLNVVLLRRASSKAAMQVGRWLMLLGGLSMLLTYLIHELNIITVLIPYLIFVLGTGFIFSNASLLAFNAFETKFGIVGALYSFLQLIFAYVTSYIAAKVSAKTQLPLAIILTMLAFIAIGAAIFAHKSKSQ